ncbi:GrpB family protein [Microbacterium arborescens]
MAEEPRNPAQLQPHDPVWIVEARAILDRIRAALDGLPGADAARFDHIGSTAVPGLDAKPIIDLQVAILPLPAEDELSARLRPAGFRREWGSRPDSPGVSRDIPRGVDDVPDEVWEKRLYVAPGADVILHVRRSDSPWARETVRFRDALCSDSVLRARYQDLKRRLSAANAGKADYDDYTRAKTAFFSDMRG